MRRLSELQAPALAGVIREETAIKAIAEIKNCFYDGANMIDLHMSCLHDTSVENLRTIIQSTKLPILALNYNTKYNNSSACLSEEERVDTFFRAIEAGAAGVDIQAYTYHLPSKNEFCGEDKYSFTKGSPKEIVTDESIIEKQCELIERIHGMGGEVLLSCHPFIPMKSDQVVDLALFLEKRKPDIIKIVTYANTDEDMIESVKTMLELKKAVKTPVSYHAAGPKGKLSRILNPALGGQIAFCIDRYSESSNMEQLDLKTVRKVVDGLGNLL
jgi:hypothetical protein